MNNDIIAFCCENSADTAADIAGREGLHYSNNVRIIRVPCAGRVDPIHVLKVFESGCSGVIVIGCESGSCHHIDGNERAKKRVEYIKTLLAEAGINGHRLAMFSVAPNAPHKFVNIIENMEKSLKGAAEQL